MSTKQKSSRQKRKWPSLRRWVAGIAIFAGLGIVLVLSIYGARSLQFDVSKLDEMPERSTVYDMNGAVYHRLFTENRAKVSIDQVSPNFVNALLAREDTRFYSHDGIDYRGMARAVFRNLSRMRASEGASTLTQQLARNSFVLGGKNIDRKLLEAVVAKRIEAKFSKKEILEFYVNRIYFGGGLYGIETASLAYFGKPSAQLTLGEGAMMAGIIRSPNRFSPFKNLEGASRERDVVLNRMEKLKLAEASAVAAAKSSPLKLAKQKSVAQETYYMDAVRRELDVLLSEAQSDEGGLRIYTTVDTDLQKIAERSLDAHLTEIERRPGYEHSKKSEFTAAQKSEEAQTPYLQGAVVVIDNRSGAIRALVGGRDFAESRYNRAIHPDAKRQVGSSFKPFVYAAAFAKGMLPGMLVDDGPLGAGEITGGDNWQPANSDGKFNGLLPADSGLIRSRNTMTIRVGEWAGIEQVRKLASDLGLGTIPNRPVVYLGAFEQTLREITAAFTIFPNQGIRKQTYLIERIDDKNGEPIYRAAHLEAPILKPAVAWMTSSALQEVFQSGTAAAAKKMGFNKPAGGKTGTTNDYKDAWFLGYTSSLTCGVWVGMDTPATISDRGYASSLALPVWAKIMKQADSKFPAESFHPPERLVEVAVCGFSNAQATGGCQQAGTLYQIKIPASLVPGSACQIHQDSPAARSRPESRERSPTFFRKLRSFFSR